MEDVATDIFVGTEFYGANVGCVLTYDGAILVDAPIVPSDAVQWRKMLEEQTGAEFVYILATDGHPCHAIGNSHFGAAPIANERAYRGMARFTPTMRERVLDTFRDWAPDIAEQLADFQVTPPEITFDQDLTLYRGGRTIRITRLGGHTPATSVLFVEDARVLFAGDLVVNGMPPFIGQGASAEWLVALDRIKQMAPQIIVPGHGPVGDLGLVDQLADFLTRLRAGVAALVSDGRSKAEVATRMLYMLDEFPIEDRWRRRAERSFRTSVARVYEEMRPEEARSEPEE